MIDPFEMEVARAIGGNPGAALTVARRVLRVPRIRAALFGLAQRETQRGD